ncbi:hypothetical protein BU15DRAFT_69115 [Melanogaster broomeanus]|nr:hypothetical protein BU15DRAFT_69115 [Melanogaster broomeanus]
MVKSLVLLSETDLLRERSFNFLGTSHVAAFHHCQLRARAGQRLVPRPSVFERPRISSEDNESLYWLLGSKLEIMKTPTGLSRLRSWCTPSISQCRQGKYATSLEILLESKHTRMLEELGGYSTRTRDRRRHASQAMKSRMQWFGEGVRAVSIANRKPDVEPLASEYLLEGMSTRYAKVLDLAQTPWKTSEQWSTAQDLDFVPVVSMEPTKMREPPSATCSIEHSRTNGPHDNGLSKD